MVILILLRNIKISRSTNFDAIKFQKETVNYSKDVLDIPRESP